MSVSRVIKSVATRSKCLSYGRSTSLRFLPSRCMSSEAMPLPSDDVGQAKVYPPKITAIVDQIAQLNLIEVADLNELLKKRLNISDAPVMMTGAVAAPSAQQKEEEAAEEAPQAVQTSFTLKLDGFAADKKVALIKEIKANSSKSTRLNSSHITNSYAVFCMQKILMHTNKIV